jgi:hypothetical protein
MSNELVRMDHNLDEIMKLGATLSQSGYFQDAKDAAQAVVKVLAGRELGFGPITSMTGVYIVKGKVTLSANLIAAAIKRSGRYNYRFVSHNDRECVLEFFEQGQSVGKSGFTIEEAQRAGLTINSTWKSYPRNMLFARALSNGAKWFCPDVFGGPIYTPDELGAEVDGDTGEMINVIPPAFEPDPVPPLFEPQVEPQIGWATLDDFLYQMHLDFYLDKEEALKTLKILGYKGFPKNGEARRKSAEMYDAVKKFVEAGSPSEPGN